MKSTGLADLFYKWDINPFYVVTVLVFLVPALVFLFFFGFAQLSILISIGLTLLVLIVFFVVFYLYFHRNPEREIVEDGRYLLSPADGKVV